MRRKVWPAVCTLPLRVLQLHERTAGRHGLHRKGAVPHHCTGNEDARQDLGAGRTLAPLNILKTLPLAATQTPNDQTDVTDLPADLSKDLMKANTISTAARRPSAPSALSEFVVMPVT